MPGSNWAPWLAWMPTQLDFGGQFMGIHDPKPSKTLGEEVISVYKCRNRPNGMRWIRNRASFWDLLAQRTHELSKPRFNRLAYIKYIESCTLAKCRSWQPAGDDKEACQLPRSYQNGWDFYGFVISKSAN